MENKNVVDLGIVTLDCTYCDEKPSLTFNGQPYYACRFKCHGPYFLPKAFKEPIALGLHKFGVSSYKGRIKLVYISPF